MADYPDGLNSNPSGFEPGCQYQGTSSARYPKPLDHPSPQLNSDFYDVLPPSVPTQLPTNMAPNGYNSTFVNQQHHRAHYNTPMSGGVEDVQAHNPSYFYPPAMTGQQPQSLYANARSSYPIPSQPPQDFMADRYGQSFTRHGANYPPQPAGAYAPPPGFFPNASFQDRQQKGAGGYQTAETGLHRTSVGAASKAVEYGFENARSVDPFLRFRGGQETSTPAQPGPYESDGTQQYDTGSRETEDTGPQNLSSAAHRNSSNVKANVETEVLGSEMISSNSASRSTISSSTVSQDVESVPSESAGRKQAMTHSTVAEVFDDVGFDLKWASADAARDHVFRRIKLSKLTNDDVEEVKKNKKKYVLHLMKAIAKSSFLGSQNQRRRNGRALNEEEQAEWTRWQTESGDVLDHVMTEFNKPMITDQIEATAWMIFEEIVKVHEFGHRPTKYVNKTSICSERLQLAVDCISEFTRVREDIFTGLDYQDFASDPTEYGKSKLGNLWSNLARALKVAAASGKPRKTKKRIATADSAVYTRLYSGAEIKRMKKEEKAAAARAGVQSDDDEDDDLDELDDGVGSGSGEQLMNPSDGKVGTKRKISADEEEAAEPPPSKRAKHQTKQGLSTAEEEAPKPKQTRASRANPQRTTKSSKAVDHRDSIDGSDVDYPSKRSRLSIGKQQVEAGAAETRDEARDTQIKDKNLTMPEQNVEAHTYADAAQRDAFIQGIVQGGLPGSIPDPSISDVTGTAAGAEVPDGSKSRSSDGMGGQTEDRYDRMASSGADGNDETDGDDQEGAVDALLNVAEMATDPDLIDFDFNAYYGQTSTN